MEYPHKRYIQFLISKRLEEYEVVADCTAHGLVPPNSDDFKNMRSQLGLATNWVARIESASPEFIKWLKDADLYELWKPDATTRAASEILLSPNLRRCFESMMLLHGDVETARNEVIASQSVSRIPTVEAFEIYCFYYWDISSISKNALFDHIKVSQENDTKIAAFQGELSVTYAMLGMRQRISTLNMHDRVVQFSDMQFELAMRHGAMMNGNQLAGLAAIARTAQDAAAMRDELQKASGDNSMKRDAAVFLRAKVLENVKLIPSVDDLKVEVIDAEFVDSEKASKGEGARIHRFPTRREPK